MNTDVTKNSLELPCISSVHFVFQKCRWSFLSFTFNKIWMKLVKIWVKVQIVSRLTVLSSYFGLLNVAWIRPQLPKQFDWLEMEDYIVFGRGWCLTDSEQNIYRLIPWL